MCERERDREKKIHLKTEWKTEGKQKEEKRMTSSKLRANVLI